MKYRYTVRHNPHGTPDREGVVLSRHRTAEAARAAAKRAAAHHAWVYAHDDADVARLHLAPCPDCGAQHRYEHAQACAIRGRI